MPQDIALRSGSVSDHERVVDRHGGDDIDDDDDETLAQPMDEEEQPPVDAPAPAPTQAVEGAGEGKDEGHGEEKDEDGGEVMDQDQEMQPPVEATGPASAHAQADGSAGEGKDEGHVQGEENDEEDDGVVVERAPDCCVFGESVCKPSFRLHGGGQITGQGSMDGTIKTSECHALVERTHAIASANGFVIERVIDIGSGTGAVVFHYALHSGVTTLGIDCVESRVQVAIRDMAHLGPVVRGVCLHIHLPFGCDL